MAQTTLSVRMDEQVKKQFDEFCSEIGRASCRERV